MSFLPFLPFLSGKSASFQRADQPDLSPFVTPCDSLSQGSKITGVLLSGQPLGSRKSSKPPRHEKSKMAPMDETAPESLVDTILFVDVDGVLNVGIWLADWSAFHIFFILN